MADLERRLGRDDLVFLFVSVDPARDTPEVIDRYLAHFGGRLAGATGTRADIDRFTAGLGLAQVVNPGADGEYTVDHSTALVLIDRRARLAGYFQAPHEPAALAADLAALPRG
jgi:protein SCO1/2